MNTKEIIASAVGILCLMTSCATYKLDKSVWYNLSLVEKEGRKAMMATSLYFFSSDTVDIYCSVRKDTMMIVEPFKYASGIYSISGDPRKEAKIKIEAETIDGKLLKYDGAYYKSEAMYLLSPDSVIKVYGKTKDVILE